MLHTSLWFFVSEVITCDSVLHCIHLEPVQTGVTGRHGHMGSVQVQVGRMQRCCGRCVFHSTLKYVRTSFVAGISEWVELNGMGIHDGFEVACRSGTLPIGE